MSPEPDALARFCVSDDLVEDPNARTITDDVRMHRELKDSALVVSSVEFPPENIEHVVRRRIGAERLKPIHHEINGVVADPFDGKLDDPGRLAVEQELVAVFVTHQGGIVDETHFLLDLERVPAEIPGRGAQADRPYAGDLLEGIGRPVHQIPFGLRRQCRVQLVNPPVNADFMPLSHDLALLVGVEQRGDGRDIEARRNTVLFQELQNPRHAHPIAVLAPRQPADRLATVTKIARLVIAVEGQGDGAPRTARPLGRAQLTPGADAVDKLAPMFLRPLPRLEVGLGSAHLFLSTSRSGRPGRREDGRSGEIRTHDPQHPMLMRYQAALRSDRAGPANKIDHNTRPKALQRARMSSSRLHFGRRYPPRLLAVYGMRQTMVDLILERMRGAKDKNAARAYRYFLTGFGIAADALSLLSDGKAAE